MPYSDVITPPCQFDRSRASGKRSGKSCIIDVSNGTGILMRLRRLLLIEESADMEMVG